MRDSQRSPESKFSWEHFDDETVLEFAAAHRNRVFADAASARQYLAHHSPPRYDFVEQTREVIEKWICTDLERALETINDLRRDGPVRLRANPQTAAQCLVFLRKCRFRKKVDQREYDNWLYTALCGHGEARVDPEDGIRPYAFIVPSNQRVDDRQPYPYQTDAWKALDRVLAGAGPKGDFAGLLVMPTGSGKTFTVARWMTERHLNHGGRVLWIAHRNDLLEQAASAFYRTAYLARNVKKLRVRIVSGVHCPPTAVDPDWQVVIWSIQSLRRALDAAKRYLDSGNVFVVIDEAHHAPAAGYRRLLDLVESHPRKRVLGLTATPTRSLEDERPVLARLFGNQKIFEKGVRELIEQGFLARPYPEVVPTETDAEQGITAEDKRHLDRFGELSEKWQERLAKMSHRNHVIVKRYLECRRQYGKTLVFAINIAHARTLCRRFQKAGVRAEYIACQRCHDTRTGKRERESNQEIIDRFRDPKGRLDVLVNVEIMTEGIDVPGIQTVFLTRPTRSEILLRQMIGRAMRGPKVPGGTERAYLVSFQDHWSRFTDWESPLDLVPDVLGESGQKIDPARPVPSKTLVDALPWGVVEAAMDELARQYHPSPRESFEAVPHGWYVLEYQESDVAKTPGYEGTSHHILPVYDHQRNCWQALINYLYSSAPPDNTDDMPTEPRTLAETEDQLYEDFFGDCDVPQVSQRLVGLLLGYYRAGGSRPDYHDFADRSRADPVKIAAEVMAQDLGEIAKAALIASRHELPLARAIYPELRVFHAAVNDAIYELTHCDEAEGEPKAEVIFEPPSDLALRPGPAHNLERLAREVLACGAKLLGVKRLTLKCTVDWTRRAWRCTFGRAYWEPNDAPGEGRIAVNRLLDSPDISKETLRFILWHEFLHVHLHHKHSKQFRELEKQWPGYDEATKDLATLWPERFNFWASKERIASSLPSRLASQAQAPARVGAPAT